MITLKQAAAWCGGTVLPEYETIAFSGARADSRVVDSQVVRSRQAASDRCVMSDGKNKRGLIEHPSVFC